MNQENNIPRFLSCLTAALLTGAAAEAQDMVVMKDGTVVQAKVTKVGHDEVEYRKWNNQDGPLYTVKVADLLAINYQNGEKDTFTQAAQTTATRTGTADNAPKEVVPVPSPQNAALIALYNNQEDVGVKGKKASDNKAKAAYPVFGITGSSVMQDSNVMIFITHHLMGYAVWVENLSGNNVYIDLANSFKINDTGNSKPYFTNKTYTSNSSSSSGGGLNLGAVAGAVGIGGVVGTLSNGINVGGGSSKGTSVTEQEERIMVIPPHGKRMLPLAKKATRKDVQDVSEKFSPAKMPGGNGLRRYEYRAMYTEENSPSVFRRSITYSTAPDFSTYTRLDIGIYLKGLLGDGGALNFFTPGEKSIQCTNWGTFIIGSWKKLQ